VYVNIDGKREKIFLVHSTGDDRLLVSRQHYQKKIPKAFMIKRSTMESRDQRYHFKGEFIEEEKLDLSEFTVYDPEAEVEVNTYLRFKKYHVARKTAGVYLVYDGFYS